MYVVAIPIGNPRDISERAIQVLKEASLVLCEDTRRAGILLAQLGTKNRLLSYYDQNEQSRVADIISKLEGGTSIALISDAGTPGISDPGFRIVRACQEAGIPVSTVPGPCAAIGALSISGLPTDRFTFEGFLPPKGAKRSRRIDAILSSTCTSIVYESTHKIEKLMAEMAEKAPNREIVIVRELTKTYEEVLRGKASELNDQIQKRGGLKGEIVVLVARVDDEDPGDAETSPTGE